MKTPPFPCQQGDLDYLCHVYAAINLLHLAEKIDTLEEAGETFRLAMRWIWRKGNLLGASTKGMWQPHVAEMFGVFGLDIDMIESPCAEDIAARAAKGAAIFIVGKDWDHYTVIRATKGVEAVQLFDSYGFREIRHHNGSWFIDEQEVTITHLYAFSI